MKRRIVLLLAAALLLLNVTACARGEASQSGSAPESSPGVQLPAPGTNAGVLDGKKVIFVGCSYTYYGGVVINTYNSVLTQEARSNDQGFFYQLCKANGAEVSVTDWCYGGHKLTDMFDGSCNADRGHDGFDHLAELKDRWFDYVVFQDIQTKGWKPETYAESAKAVMDVFRAANPDVKFLYTVHDGAYMKDYPTEWKASIERIEQMGVTIVDWGTLVWDVLNGHETVPGATQSYNKSSFIVSDGYHPNLLSGYLSALMTYCAITGETAVGQDYSFCTADPVDKYLDAAFVKSSYYKTDDPLTAVDERKTNFVEIFGSSEDMKGLQILADRYLAQPCKFHPEYTVTFRNEDGSVLSSKDCRYGDIVLPPARPKKASDAQFSYACVGWDKEVTDCLGDAEYTAVFKATPLK